MQSVVGVMAQFAYGKGSPGVSLIDWSYGAAQLSQHEPQDEPQKQTQTKNNECDNHHPKRPRYCSIRLGYVDYLLKNHLL